MNNITNSNFLKDSTCLEDAEEIYESICLNVSEPYVFMNDVKERAKLAWVNELHILIRRIKI